MLISCVSSFQFCALFGWLVMLYEIGLSGTVIRFLSLDFFSVSHLEFSERIKPPFTLCKKG